MLSLQNVIYRYQTNMSPVLTNLSFSVKRGERIAVVGRNGSGKSTLARVLKGLLTPSEGQIVYESPFTREDIGMLFQNPDNQAVSTIVEDDVAFGLENACVERDEITNRIEHYAQKLGISHLLKRNINELSGGQKQRVALTGLLVLKPKLLLLDEACSMLDPVGRKIVQKHIGQFHSEGHSIISITHDVEEILSSDRVLGLVGGKLIYDGSPHHLFSKKDYLHELGLIKPFQYELVDLLENKGIDVNVSHAFSNKELLQLLWTYRLNR
ncbi:ATPase component of general energizing module of ECF transporters [Bacillus sp. JCM 19046]|nr:ATPase component of general energizing module of ECF transporters [Bacillus sp. JCM 19045]GAF18729.1 ATPase component of general energizing module of ECF transporters [Bacillus sp. JCM 19046]